MNPVVSYCMEQMAAKKHKPLHPDPDPRFMAPMHFWALEDGSTVSFLKQGNAPARINLVSWDGDTWEVWDGSALTLDLGNVLYVKCQTDAALWTGSGANYWHFDCTGKICVGGQLRSIVESTNYWDRTRANTRAFYRLFYQNHSLISAETLRLTQDTVTNNDKYNSMFYECINLRRGPAITVKACTGNNMCLDMFRMCVSLDKPPVIWTQTIGSQAFTNMFYLSGIRRAPNLLPTHYPYRACYYMFYECINLETLPRMRVRSLNATGTIGGEFGNMYAYCNNLVDTDASKYIDIDLTRANVDMFAGMFAYTNITKAPKMHVHVQAEATARTGIFNGTYNYALALEDASTVDIDADEIYTSQFQNMFQNCVHLRIAPHITARTSNPALARANACTNMFYHCCLLEDVSSVNITVESSTNTLFYGMFNTCRRLVRPPTMDITLSGTQSNAFQDIFNACGILEDASSVHIKTTVIGTSMFQSFVNSCNLLFKPPVLDVQGTVAKSCYYNMFANCWLLTKFPKLPFEGPAQDSCCYGMFSYCYSMEEPPDNFNIIGTQASFCRNMFSACFSLRRLPDRLFRAAENSYAYAYYQIAQDCRSLTEIPEIMLRTNTSTTALSNAFYNCVNLSRIKTHQKNWTGCGNWLSSVRTALTEIYLPLPTGGGRKRTFICPADAPQTRGASAIPQNWELETFDEP